MPAGTMRHRPIRLVRWLVLGLLLVLLAPGLRAQPYPEVARQSLLVPVRDGTRLAVHLYRPADAAGQAVPGRFPVVFMFTPYRGRFVNAQGQVEEAALSDRLAMRSLIRAGYVVAVGDVRGWGASFGARRGFQDRTEAMDGHDLVEWLARQEFSTGAVGVIGCSYPGGAAMHILTTTPPSLRAAFIGATDWDKYGFVRQGGITAQFNTRPDEPIEYHRAALPVDGDDGTLLAEAIAEHAANTPMAPLWYGMPYRDSVSELTGNAFWEEVAVWRHAEAIRASGIPTYLWSNWEDEPTMQVIIAAHNLGSRLLVGPGSHCVPPAGMDFNAEIIRFFDYHLKGLANAIDQQPPVTYWVETGPGEGHYQQDYAVPGARSATLALYLAPHAEGAEAGGLAPRPVSGADRFTVDYDLPGGDYFAFWPAPLDEHGIVYDSAPLTAPMDLLGYPVAHVALTASTADAEVFVYLEEVQASGAVRMLSFGRLQLSHRALAEAPWDNLGLPWSSGYSQDVRPLATGEVARLAIAMMPLARRIAAGSRLRFVITGADPRQRNLAEVRQDPPPVFTILSGWEAGSRIELPLAPTVAGE